MEQKDSIKGEYIIIVNNLNGRSDANEENQNSMNQMIENGISNNRTTKDILQELVEKKLTNNMNKKDLYKLILEKSEK